MRTRERLTGLKKWLTEELCAGREMKAPAPDMDIGKIIYREPECFIGWAPQRLDDETGQWHEQYQSSVPSITIMPNPGKIKAMEEKRFDRYNNIHRPKAMGQTLSVSMLFSVYEPGTRLPGFAFTSRLQDRIDASVDNYPACKDQKGINMELIREGTQEGLFTLTDWMDECMERLLAANSIPGTDLFVDNESGMYSLYTDQSYVVDKRPLYYGFINIEFACYANEMLNGDVQRLLNE